MNAAVVTMGCSSDGCDSAQGGADPGEQFAHAERFGDVVVGAGVEGVDLGFFYVAGGQHDDRQAGPGADSFDDGEAVHVGQA